MTSEFILQTDFNIVHTNRVYTTRVGTCRVGTNEDCDELVVPDLLVLPVLLSMSAFVIVQYCHGNSVCEH